MFGVYVNDHLGRKLQLHCSLWAHIFSFGHMHDVISSRWKSPAVWDVTKGGTSLRVELSGSSFLLCEIHCLLCFIYEVDWSVKKNDAIKLIFPVLNRVHQWECAALQHPLHLLFSCAGHMADFLLETILQDQEADWMNMFFHKPEGYCRTASLGTFTWSPQCAFCCVSDDASHFVNVYLKGSFAKTDMSIFIFQNLIFFYCAVKGISIKLLLVYSF